MNSETSWKLQPKVTIQHHTAEIFAVKFSPDGMFLAVGCGDGSVKVYNTRTGIEVNKLQEGSSGMLPITSIKFRPVPEGAVARTKNVFIAANTSGQVQHWHMSSGKCLHSMDLGPNSDEEIYAVDYDRAGQQFITAGKSRVIRLYDEDTKTLISELQGGSGLDRRPVAPGHANRIFAAKFVPHDNNLIITGGWDK